MYHITMNTVTYELWKPVKELETRKLSKRRSFPNPISLECCPALMARFFDELVQKVASWCLFVHFWNLECDKVAPENVRIKN